MNQKRARVNVKTLVNSKAIRSEKRDGRDVIIVPSATMPDGVVMNGIRYPAEAIANGYKSLEGTPAPLGHPTYEGEFVSASDPRGLVRGFIGAWNENVRQEGGRVLLDKVIDVEYAQSLESGRRVLNAIEKGQPIHTSTGLYCSILQLENDADGVELEANEIVFDHDAILLDERGAATPDQGVGMMVNKAREGEASVEMVVNSIYEEASNELEWAADWGLRAAERLARRPLLERIKQAILDTVLGEKGSGPETSTNQEEEQGMNDAQFEKLSGQLNEAVATGMASVAEGLKEVLTNALKPVADMVAAQNAAALEAEAAKKADLVTRVVNAGLLPQEVADASPVATLEALVANSQKPAPQTAYRLNAHKSNETKAVLFDLPEAE